MMNDTLSSSHDICLVTRCRPKQIFCCVLCQTAVDTFVNSQQPESYAKFLEAISRCAELDEGDFPDVSRWLHQYTTAQLVDEVKLLSNCYEDTVNYSKRDCALKAHRGYRWHVL